MSDFLEKDKNKIFFFSFFISVFTFLIYFKVKDFAFLDFDDSLYISQYVRNGFSLSFFKWAFTNFFAANWHPVTWISHLIDAQFFGLSPKAAHIHNLILHILNSSLLFILFFKILKNHWQAFFIAIFFAIHPMHIESVAWISERKDLLCTFFWFLSSIFYVDYIKNKSSKKYWLCFFTFVLGAMSKPMIVSLPFVFLLFDFWPYDRANLYNKNESKDTILSLILEKIPFFIVSIIVSILTVLAQKELEALTSFSFSPFYVRILNAIHSYFFYIYKFILPFNLSCYYPYSSSISYLLSFVEIVVLFLLFFFLFKQYKKNSALVFGMLWFFGTLFPVIGIIQVGSQAHADRYTYIPYIGLFLILALYIPKIFEKFKISKIILIFFSFLFVFFLSYRTYTHLDTWKNSKSLFLNAIKNTKNNYMALNGYASALINENKDEEAIKYLKQAEALDKKSEMLYSNFGNVFFHLGFFDKALEYFSQAIKIKPNDYKIHRNIGLVFLKNKKYDEAIDALNKAIKFYPDFTAAYNDLGTIYMQLEEDNKALLYFLKAVELDNQNFSAYYNLALLNEKYGKIDKALKYYQEALKYNQKSFDIYYAAGDLLHKITALDKAYEFYQKASSLASNQEEKLKISLKTGNYFVEKANFNEAIKYFRLILMDDPNYPDANFGMGYALKALGNVNGAISYFMKELKININHARCYNNLGLILTEEQKFFKAEGYFKKALELEPKNSSFCLNVGTSLARQGKIVDAGEYFEKALKLDPENQNARANLQRAKEQIKQLKLK